MNNYYLELRNQEKVEIKSPTRKQRIKIAELSKGDTEDNAIEYLEQAIFVCLNGALTKEEFDDALDYNCDTYGFNETYELLGYIIKDVFTEVDSEKKDNPLLQEMRKKHQTPLNQ